MHDALLSIQNLTLHFGGVTAVNGVTFDICQGQIVGLIGPNGAGKTSLINLITGTYNANEGEVYLNNANILQKPIFQRARLGLSRTFQNLALFNGMTVYDNVMVGRHLHISEHAISSFLPMPWARQSSDEKQSTTIVESLLDRFGLSELRNEEVGSLPYGFQKRVELARALASEPLVLMLDEPFAGMTPTESRELAKVILEIWIEKKLTILMIEHNMGLIMDLADIVVVLDFGKLVALGPPEEIKINPKVIKAYIGDVDAELS